MRDRRLFVAFEKTNRRETVEESVVGKEFLAVGAKYQPISAEEERPPQSRVIYSKLAQSFSAGFLSTQESKVSPTRDEWRKICE